MQLVHAAADVAAAFHVPAPQGATLNPAPVKPSFASQLFSSADATTWLPEFAGQSTQGIEDASIVL